MSFDIHLPSLKPAQIQDRCTKQSFIRGTEYFHAGAIGNPALHGYTLSATCQGTEMKPYRVSAELMPTGIAATRCSCPYSYEGDCKHIVALLLNYIYTPDVIRSVDALLATLAEKPKAHLLHVISELLKRRPALVPVVQGYTDMEAESELEGAPPPDKFAVCATVTVYRERIDRIFGDSFLEQNHLHQVLVELEELIAHVESLAQVGETEFALSILHALIHQSITRYADTLQKRELPRFVNTCAKRFVDIATSVQTQTSNAQTYISSDLSLGDQETVPESLAEHCRLLLPLSFEAEPVFTPILTGLLEHVPLLKKNSQIEIEQRLDESPDRQAHVQLLLALYCHAGNTEEYLRLARRENEGYRLIRALFRLQHDDTAWQALEEFPLSAEEYGCLLKSPIATRVPHFTERLLTLVTQYQPDTAITLYQRLIEQTVLSRKREAYQKVFEHLTVLRSLYLELEQEDRWDVYLAALRKRHARKRLLLQMIDAQ